MEQEANTIREDFLEKMGLKLDILRPSQVLPLWYPILLGLSSISSITTSCVTLSKLTSQSFNFVICKIGIITVASKASLRIQ